MPVIVLCLFLIVPCNLLFQYQMIFHYLNEVLSDISNLPFVQNKGDQYSVSQLVILK